MPKKIDYVRKKSVNPNFVRTNSVLTPIWWSQKKFVALQSLGYALPGLAAGGRL